MRLKKHLNRKDKNTGQEFYRYDITINPEIIKELGWKGGDELEVQISGNILQIKKKRSSGS